MVPGSNAGLGVRSPGYRMGLTIEIVTWHKPLSHTLDSHGYHSIHLCYRHPAGIQRPSSIPPYQVTPLFPTYRTSQTDLSFHPRGHFVNIIITFTPLHVIGPSRVCIIVRHPPIATLLIIRTLSFTTPPSFK